MTKRASEALAGAGQSLVSLAKLVAESRPCSIRRARVGDDQRIVILGNGPSLNDTLHAHAELLRRSVTMAVNFMANTPVFAQIRPRYYMLIDPLFFSGRDLPNLLSLNRALAAVDWPMTLIVPVRYRRCVDSAVASNPNITVATVNAVGVEGWGWLKDMAYSRAWGMPRPRNVLIPAIMAAIQMGYKQIYITGADHSWLRTIDVNEHNQVVSVQPHFYREDDKEVKRINTEYLHYPLHQILHSFYVAFRSYHDIRRYADRHGVRVYNATPVSMIDAFERRSL